MNTKSFMKLLIYNQYNKVFGVNTRTQQLNRTYSDHAYFHQIGNKPLVYRNLGQQLQSAVQKYGKRMAIISCQEDKRLTFEEVKHEAEILTVQLKRLGLQRGEHLGIWAPNTIQWYISFLAAALGGFPLVCINPAFQPQELAYTLNKAKVKVLITLDECGKQNFYDVLKQLLRQSRQTGATIVDDRLPHLQRIIMKSAQPTEDFLQFNEMLELPVRTQDVFYLNVKVPEISPESTCNIQFTSGTTGQAKAAVMSHFNFVNQGHYFGMFLNLHTSPKHICLTVPFFHAYGLSVVVAALDHGATLVLPSASFSGAAAVEAIEQESCNIILGTPTMFVDMLEHQCRTAKNLKSLELGLVGGSACSPELYSRVKTVFGLKQMLIGYGQTETTAATFTHDGSENENFAMHTVGRLFDHGEAKVVDDNGETVKFGMPGELCVRGYFNMRGYFEDVDKTSETLSADGWLRTGDEFILEASGIGRIVGRKKDVIIRGGENIYPKEIEDFLDLHEQILEAQVIGVPDDRMGEELCAFIRLKPGVKPLTADDIKEFCKGNIAHYKVPRYVRVVEDFPKTTSGKIQKFKLKELI